MPQFLGPPMQNHGGFDLLNFLHRGNFPQQGTKTVDPNAPLSYGQRIAQGGTGSLSSINFNAPGWEEQLRALYPGQLLAGDQGVFGNFATRGDQSLQQYLAGGGQPIRPVVQPGSSVTPYSTYGAGNTGVRPNVLPGGGWDTGAKTASGGGTTSPKDIAPVDSGSPTNFGANVRPPTGSTTSTSAAPISPGDDSRALTGGAAPATTPSTDWNSLFHPGGYDGNVLGYDAITGQQPGSVSSPTVPGAGSAGEFPTGAETLGQSMYPWLTPYAGNFTAPMSKQENQGLQGISNFVEGGQNLGGAQQYLNSLLSGQFLSPETNPYLQKVANAASGIHDYQDQLERQRIASSMAAGGNALSGARGAAEEQYQNESNNQFENMLNNMFNQNYQNERGLMQQGVPLEMGMANQVLGGYNNEMNAGGLPRQLSQADLTAQYGDYLRQINGLQQAYNQPYTNAMGALSHGYTAGTSPSQYGTSEATGIAALLASLFGGGGGGGLLGSSGSDGSGGSGLLGLLNSLFGGGGSSGGAGTQLDPNAVTNYYGDYGNSGGGAMSSGDQNMPDYTNSLLSDPQALQQWEDYLNSYYQGGGT